MSEREQTTEVFNMLLGGIGDVISDLQKMVNNYPDATKIEVSNTECCGSEDCSYYGCSCTYPIVSITRPETNAEMSDRLAADEKERLRMKNAADKEARQEKKCSDLRLLQERYEKSKAEIQSRY